MTDHIVKLLATSFVVAAGCGGARHDTIHATTGHGTATEVVVAPPPRTTATADPTPPEPTAKPEATAEGDLCVVGMYMQPSHESEEGLSAIALTYPRYSNEGYRADKYGESFPVTVAELAKLSGAEDEGRDEFWLKKPAGTELWSIVSAPAAECPPVPKGAR